MGAAILINQSCVTLANFLFSPFHYIAVKMDKIESDNQTKAIPLNLYGYLAFFVVLNYLNMLDRNLLAAFAPSIVVDLDISDAQYSLLTGLIFVTVCATTGLFVYRFISSDTQLFYMTITFVYVSFSYDPLLVSIQDLTPAPYRATMLGFQILLINIIGDGGSAGLVGWLSDYLRSVNLGKALSYSLFSAGLITLIAIPCLLIAVKHYRNDVAKLHQLDLNKT